MMDLWSESSSFIFNKAKYMPSFCNDDNLVVMQAWDRIQGQSGIMMGVMYYVN